VSTLLRLLRSSSAVSGEVGHSSSRDSSDLDVVSAVNDATSGFSEESVLSAPELGHAAVSGSFRQLSASEHCSSRNATEVNPHLK
jgi:hypothetical protein